MKVLCFLTVFQHVMALAQPVYRQLRQWIPATLTSLSTALKSTATWCSSSQGSKGESRERVACQK